MRIALAQFDPVVGALDANADEICQLTVLAKEQGADLVVFPELALCGYPPLDLAVERWFIEANQRAIEQLSARLVLPAIVGHIGMPSSPAELGWNAASLLDEGAIVATRAKCLLPTYDVFDEVRLFTRGGKNVPVVWRGHRLGISICEDLWGGVPAGEPGRYVQDPIAELVEGGIDLLINLSASPFSVGHPARRATVVCEAARKWSVPIVQSNLVGATDDLIFDGQSIAVDESGTFIERLPSFRAVVQTIDLASSPRPSTASSNACNADTPSNTPSSSTVFDASASECLDALCHGLQLYMRKCGFEDVILGLSGGIDSAVVTALATLALGPRKVHAITMPSEYSSEGSWLDSRALATNLGISLAEISIHDLVTTQRQLLQPHLGELGTSVTAQNLQARSRGLILMAHANQLGYLLLATGNKSELAVGYATLYGDMCGGLLPIGDLYKGQVERLGRVLNLRLGAAIPEAIFAKAPSAELAPEQRDSDSLPPYPVLDPILESLIEAERGIEGTVATGTASRDVVESVAWMLARAEHKRRQAPPILRVSSRVFGRGRRFCIAAKPFPQRLDG